MTLKVAPPPWSYLRRASGRPPVRFDRWGRSNVYQVNFADGRADIVIQLPLATVRGIAKFLANGKADQDV